MAKESISHLFWSCDLPAWAWSFIGKWWSINSLIHRNASFNLALILGLKKSKFIKPVWHLTVAATLWSIWLARNEFVFSNTRLKADTLQELIFVRIAKWGMASGVLSFAYDPTWRINPIGAISLHHHQLRHAYWASRCEVYDIICMSDAAWVNNCGGVGGIIKLNTGKLLYCFSGPSNSFNVHEAEVLALIHILNKLRSICSPNDKVVICTDSTVAINAFSQGLKVDFPLLIPDFDVQKLLDNSVCLNFIPSELNDEADHLAKGGINRLTTKYFWASRD
ncbi:hypothetical protein DCAR_0519576 [Daucus carota subsp. sativus]|uniref:RNase H type-1 domain-containing protein n=1 Tax=Daucus carota subsp. sativus TaxID=79200 RepID=A0AAF1B0Q3_DAUCS|nr:hypothetical protein DCAR_0519576 [Daucus carota subsp. sativus]